MSSYGNDPAFSPLHIGETAAPGLTKREYFAGQVLAGMMANTTSTKTGSYRQIAAASVIAADILLEVMKRNPT